MKRWTAVAALVLAVGCTSPPRNNDGAIEGDAADVMIACIPGMPTTRCPFCQPRSTTCASDARGVQTCRDDGSGYESPVPCNVASGDRCSNGTCVRPCDDAARTNSYLGCEFYAVGALNSGLGHAYEAASREDFPWALVIANPWPEPVAVTLDGGGLPGAVERVVGPSTTLTVRLPWNLMLAEGVDRRAMRSVAVREASVRVRSALPISAYQFSPYSFLSFPECEGPTCFAYSADASLLLPTHALRRQYVIASWPTVRIRPRDTTQWTVAPGFVAIVGISDTPTQVSVRVQSNTGPDANTNTAAVAGETIQRTLARGEVWQLVSANDRICQRPEPDTARGDIYCAPERNEDLTGSIVTASAPVAVFAGHDCALVPHDRYACDHLEEQLFPIESLGTRYVLARMPAVAAEPTLVRIVATRADTTLQFDPPLAGVATRLAREGDVLTFEQSQSVALTASQPVLVTQLLVGAGYDREHDDAVLGDPDLVQVVSTEQHRRSYVFLAAPDYPDARAIVVTLAGEPFALDGRRITSAPSERVGDYEVHTLGISAGPHRIEALRANARIGVTVSGVAPYVSYTYPAGLDLTPIGPPL